MITYPSKWQISGQIGAKALTSEDLDNLKITTMGMGSHPPLPTNFSVTVTTVDVHDTETLIVIGPDTFQM